MEIGSTPNVATVYDGAGFSDEELEHADRPVAVWNATWVDAPLLRTRSQSSGHLLCPRWVRPSIMTVRNSLVFWDNLKLLGHADFSRHAALREKKRRKSRSRNWRSMGRESWPRKSAQGAKWSFCLTAGTMSPRIRSDHEQTSTPEPHTGLQGEGGACRRQGRSNTGAACRAVRRASEPDHIVEGAARGLRRCGVRSWERQRGSRSRRST